MKKALFFLLAIASLTFFACQSDPDKPKNNSMSLAQLSTYRAADPDFKQAAMQIRTNEQQLNKAFILDLSESELEALLSIQTKYGGLAEGSLNGTVQEKEAVQNMMAQLNIEPPTTLGLALTSLEGKTFNARDLPHAMINATALLSPQLEVNNPCAGLCENVYMTRYYADYTDIYARTGDYHWADLQASRNASSAKWGCLVACAELLAPE